MDEVCGLYSFEVVSVVRLVIFRCLRIFDFEVVEVVEPAATPTATMTTAATPTTTVSVGCAAGEFCGMKTIPLGSAHTCLNCRRHLHGCLCSSLWDERGTECKVTVEDLTAVRKIMSKSNGAVICYACMQ